MTPEEIKAAEDHLRQLLDEATAPWSLRAKAIVIACIAALVVLAGVAFWPAAPIHEVVKAAPQEREADGSLKAAQAPDAHPPPPKMILPRGAVRERAGKIVAHQAPGASSVEIDTEFVRVGDRREMHVSSPDGTIDTAVDIPIEPALIPPPPKPWAAGLSYGTNRSIGLWVDRDIGRLVVGAAVNRLQDGRTEAQLRVGVRF